MPLDTENTINFKNISKVANINVELCAELGKTSLSLNDIIEYDTGSIIELNKNEDEPVNIYVNDILIAKGQIVAVENSYGIKIVEIIENKNIEKTQNADI